MFAGLTSRCTSPARCAASSAEATGEMNSTARPGASAPSRSSTRRRSPPATNRIAMNSTPSASPASYTGMMCGCVHLRRRPRLRDEPPPELLVRRHLRREDLQRHQSAQPLIAGAEHHRHPARPDPLLQSVPRQRPARPEFLAQHPSPHRRTGALKALGARRQCTAQAIPVSGCGNNRPVSIAIASSFLNWCFLWQEWSLAWPERVAGVAGPLADLATLLSVGLPGIPGSLELRVEEAGDRSQVHKCLSHCVTEAPPSPWRERLSHQARQLRHLSIRPPPPTVTPCITVDANRTK